MTDTQRKIMRIRRRIKNLENILIKGRNQRMLTSSRRLAESQRANDKTVMRERIALMREELENVTKRGRDIADCIIELELIRSSDRDDKSEEKSIELTEELRCLNEEKREIKSEIAILTEQLKNTGYGSMDTEGELAYRKARREFLMEEYSRELKRLDRLNRRLFRDTLEGIK